MTSSEYQRYMQSAEWKAKSDAAKERAGYKCAVCGHDWKKRGWGPLTSHHPDYSKLYHETYGDLVPLCRAHHPKGKFSRENIAMYRSSYRWRKRVTWVFRMAWRLLRWLAGYKSPPVEERA